MNLYDKTLDELKEIIPGKPFHSKQIYEWLYKGVTDYSCMTNLPNSLRNWLEENTTTAIPKVMKTVGGKEATKYLFLLEDGETVEGVVMLYGDKYSMCISTQVGCAQGCQFCASTKGGLVRNLTPAEMIGQIMCVQKDIPISNIVLMGIVEPLCNLPNVLRFLENVNQGLGIGARHITLSTCGIVEGIRKLMEKRMQITLSISLHAPHDTLRQQLMPIAQKVPIQELIAVCKEYFEVTKRRITFEYALIEGINDQKEHALALCSLLKGFPCHVNLIPINPIAEKPYKSPSEKVIRQFQDILLSHHLQATRRRTLGKSVHAACGQLRNVERNGYALLCSDPSR